MFEKAKNVVSKLACCAGAVALAPSIAFAQETPETPLTDMVKTISLTDAMAAVAAAAGVLITLAVVVYGAKKVIAFFGR